MCGLEVKLVSVARCAMKMKVFGASDLAFWALGSCGMPYLPLNAWQTST